MKLLTKAIEKKIPALHGTEGQGMIAVAVVKYFCPWNSWTWYGVEYDGEDTMYGYVVGMAEELGYFSLKELAAIKGPYGLGIERDLYYSPKTLKEIAG